MSATQEARSAVLIEDFEVLTDWEDRYTYLIDLSKHLPPLPPGDHVDQNLVFGCQSQVWVTVKPRETSNGTVLDVQADSNSLITKGIVAILVQVYSGETAQDILSFEVDQLMQRLGLDQHLSAPRRNGLSGMVAKIKSLAAANL